MLDALGFDAVSGQERWQVHRDRKRHRLKSTPRKRTVRHRMQLPFRVTRKAEWREQRRIIAEKLRCDELADADHLEAVVRIGDHVDIVAKAIENRKAVGCEASDAAG